MADGVEVIGPFRLSDNSDQGYQVAKAPPNVPAEELIEVSELDNVVNADFSGQIEDFQVHDKPLKPAEVVEVMNEYKKKTVYLHVPGIKLPIQFDSINVMLDKALLVLANFSGGRPDTLPEFENTEPGELLTFSVKINDEELLLYCEYFGHSYQLENGTTIDSFIIESHSTK